MSKVSINQYYTNLDRAIQFGKSKNETTIRNYFWILLNDYARNLNYEVVTEVACFGTKGKKVYPDGILKNLFGLDIGLWESKDEKDNIDDEIDAKLKRGYPFTNILFEDSHSAILYQRGEEVMRVLMRDVDSLHNIIIRFISFKSDTVHKFEDALEKFKADIPIIVETLRKRIEETRLINENFIISSGIFLELCKTEINPDITSADVREMMIQHILTSDIFNKIFDDSEFHRHNNIACELEKLIEILFTYSERKNLMGNIEHYYDAINSTAAGISDHHEKQKFLKVLYETFYKVYNPKGADRLGVVYTPNEIVQFMVDSTNYLLEKFFGKTLADKNVEILDPATGTGTFITFIIDSIPKQHLAYKYKNEICANEVAILPYYISNLNIEYTFKQKMDYYEEFKNLCFVDTLDNIDALHYAGKQHDLFGLSSENTERIHRQNSKKISVIIGNPPYNANQKNENDNNKNREYPQIDKRIKNTYIKYSTAQKSKVYDMYSRFYRWASDRLDKNGVLAFITNRSFIDSRTFDGFRKCIQDDFTACYIIDTKSDVRANPKIAGTTHNVFGIQTGVAIMFLVKKENLVDKCKIDYFAMEDNWRKEIKLDWLRNHKLENISFEKITPDKNNNWINLANNDFDNLLPTIDKINKLSNVLKNPKVLYRYYSNGVVTNRDEWVYDFDDKVLSKKINFFYDEFNNSVDLWNKEFKRENYYNKNGEELLKISNDYILSNNPKIKWSGRLFRDKLLKNRKGMYDSSFIRNCNYRPYVCLKIYYDYIPIDIQGQLQSFFPNEDAKNVIINFNGPNNVQWFSFACKRIVDLGSLYGGTQCIPLYYFNEKGERNDNITDWGLEQFLNHYKDKRINKEDIFHYTYAVLNNPAYRKKYELNLRREFPHLPFYTDFWKWTEWGKQLIDLHINYEKAEPFALKENTHKLKEEANRPKEMFAEAKELEVMYPRQPKIKVKLKAVKEAGIIEIDELTFLTGVPKEAWDYKLGNRSALEWVLDQYKEKKPKDPIIAEKFNTYRFADHKDKVIDLLKRVCTVSVETVRIIKEIEQSTDSN